MRKIFEALKKPETGVAISNLFLLVLIVPIIVVALIGANEFIKEKLAKIKNWLKDRKDAFNTWKKELKEGI